METTIGQRILAAALAHHFGISTELAMHLYVSESELDAFWEEFGEELLGRLRPALGEPSIGERILAAVIGFQLEADTDRVLKFCVQGRTLDRSWDEAGETLLRALRPAPGEPMTHESGKPN